MKKILKVISSVLFIVGLLCNRTWAEIKYSENKEGIVIENLWYKAAVYPDAGGVIKSLYLKSSETDLTYFDLSGLDYRGFCEDFGGEEGWPGEASSGKYGFEVVEKSKDRISINLWYVGMTKSVQNFRFEKTYTFRADTPVIQVDIQVRNEGRLREFSYRSRNAVRVNNAQNSKDLYFAPMTGGIDILELQSTNKHELYIKNFVKGWIGKLDKTTGAGLVFKTDYNKTNNFYYCLNKSNAGTCEWWYDKVLLEPKETWQTTIYIIPTKDIFSYAYASENMTIELNKKEVDKGLQIDYKILGLLNKEVEITTEIIGLNNQVIAQLKSEQITLYPHQLTKTSLFWKNAEEGTYGIKTEIKEKNKLIDSFISPVKIGKTDRDFVIARPEKLTTEKTEKSTEKEIKEDAKKEGLNVLLVQWYSGDGYFNVMESLKSIPETVNIKTSQFIGRSEKGVPLPLKNFPLTLNELLNYDILILEGIPFLSIGDNNMKNIIAYVEQGGALIVLGGVWAYHGTPRGTPIGNYKDTLLEELLPVNIWNDRDLSSIERITIERPEHPIVIGIPWHENLKESFNKVKSKENAQVLISSEKNPVLTVWDYGKGRVAAFPLSLASELDLKSPTAQKDRLVMWDFYDDLWRQLVSWCVKKPEEVGFAICRVPGDKVYLPDNLLIEFDIKNYDSTKIVKGTLLYSLFKDGKKIDEKEMLYNLKPDEKNRYSHQIKIIEPRGIYYYKVDLKNEEGKVISYRDGNIIARPKTNIEIDLTPRNVFGKDSKVNFALEIESHSNAELNIKSRIVDFRNRVVKQFPEINKEVENALKIEQDWVVSNLDIGEYRIVAEIYIGDKAIDKTEKNFYIAPWLDEEDYFPIVMWGSMGSSTIGYQIRPKDEEMTDRELSILKDLGINAIHSPYTFELDLYDKAQRFGMAYCVQASKDSWFNYTVKNDKCLSADYPESQYLKILEDLKTYHDNSPRILYLYYWDEPGVGTRGFTGVDKKKFKEKYGYDMPSDMKDRNYYYTQIFRTSSSLNQIKKINNYFKSYNPRKYKSLSVITPHSIGNITGCLVDIVGLANNNHYISIDPYTFGYNVDYNVSALWSATNFGKGAFVHVVNTAGSNLGGPYYPNSTAEKCYSSLTHGAKGLEWYILIPGYCDFADPVERPEHFSQAKKALTEMKLIGPLFKHLKKEQAKATVLFPWTTFALDSPPDKSISFMGSKGMEYRNFWILLEKLLGSADMIYEQQIDEGYLANYNLLFIPTAKYIPESVLKKIKEWVENGGYLVTTSGSCEYNEHQEKTDTLLSIFSLDGKPSNYGKGKTFLLVDKYAGLLDNFVKEADTLVVKAKTDGISARLFKDEKSDTYYISMVNHNQHDINTKILIKLPKKDYYIFDLITGGRIDYSYDEKGILESSLEVGNQWGRAIAILSTMPTKLRLNMAAHTSLGKEFSYQIELLDANGRIVNCKLPIVIKVIDSEGKERTEYGGIHVLKEGVYEKKILLSENAPVGDWKIIVEENISKQVKEGKLKVKTDKE